MSIAVGILCFGEENYFIQAKEKIENLIENDFEVYVLTDNVNYFSGFTINIFEYNRTLKSYHDKIILVKKMMKNHDISILLDADQEIYDWSVLSDLKTYEYKYGISYLENLQLRRGGPSTLEYLLKDNGEWDAYKRYLQNVYPNYNELETIWEYMVIFNKNGFHNNFFGYYEKLQIYKEFSDINFNKTLIGPGEGASMMLSAKLSTCDIQKDTDLYNLIIDKIRPQ